MIFVALGLIAFGAGDLVRWSPGRVSAYRAIGSAIAGSVAVMLVAALSGMGAGAVLVCGLLAAVVLLPWSLYDLLPPKQAKPEYALAWVIVAFILLSTWSGAADPVGGKLADWYRNLGFAFVDSVPVGQFLLAVGAVTFLLVSGNRLVRYMLAATGVSLLEGEGSLRGGRVLGPIERLMVAAAIIAGGFAGAGLVIAAKGLLRFREIRGDGEVSAEAKVDEITEYFLIGTFTSILIAGSLGLLVLAAA